MGFKWFVDGLLDGSLGFGGEESAGASFVEPRRQSYGQRTKTALFRRCCPPRSPRRWGATPANFTASSRLEFGDPVYDRVEAPRHARAKGDSGEALAGASPLQRLWPASPFNRSSRARLGNDAPIGGLKVMTKNGWFAARPSGTEDIYKIYAESFQGPDHLRQILDEAQSDCQRMLSQRQIRRRDHERPSARQALDAQLSTHRASMALIPLRNSRWICAGRGIMRPTGLAAA